jgi:hypothetical protein
MSDEQNLTNQEEESGAEFLVDPVSDDDLESVSGGLGKIDDGGCANGSGCTDGTCFS